jgi:hypothetical protein
VPRLVEPLEAAVSTYEQHRLPALMQDLFRSAAEHGPSKRAAAVRRHAREAVRPETLAVCHDPPARASLVPSLLEKTRRLGTEVPAQMAIVLSMPTAETSMIEEIEQCAAEGGDCSAERRVLLEAALRKEEGAS